jgi:hypothetical protein
VPVEEEPSAQSFADRGDGCIACFANAAIHFAAHNRFDLAQTGDTRSAGGTTYWAACRPAHWTTGRATRAAATAATARLRRVADLELTGLVQIAKFKIRMRATALAIRYFSASLVAASQLHGSGRGTIVIGLLLSSGHCNSSG